MKVFNLPDLGEGLPDAEIVEWLVEEGDTVELDQPLVFDGNGQGRGRSPESVCRQGRQISRPGRRCDQDRRAAGRVQG